MTESETRIVSITREDDDTCKAIQVEKVQDLDIDLGTLLATDRNFLSLDELKSNKEDYLKALARDNMQLLANAIWKLETERVEDSVVVKLPQPTYVLPREKPVPKPRPLTKWQQFAKDKGIRKTKKPKLNWDEVLKKWVPTHGYKRAAAEKEKNWLIEIPDHADPYEDYFEKKNESKKEKVAKNEFQRLRNIAKAKNIKVPSMGLPPTNKLTSVQLNSAANIANISTASVGKFQPRLSKEKTLNKSSILPTEKRKHTTMSKEEEHSHLVNLANTVLNKRPKLDMEKAVNREINSQQIEESERKASRQKGGKGGQRGKGKGGKRKNKGGKGGGGGGFKSGKGDRKPSGAKGKRVFKGSGRKRR